MDINTDTAALVTGGANGIGFAVGEALDAREVRRLYDVNVIGAVNTVQAFHPALAARAASRRTARIVFTGSENSVGLPALRPASVYTSTKYALLGIADALRRDLAESQIEVSIVCPGLTAPRLRDGRAARQDRYSGPVHVAQEEGAAIEAYLKSAGQDPALSARITLDGIACDEFLITNDPVIRELAEKRHGEVAAALDRLDQRLGEYAAAEDT